MMTPRSNERSSLLSRQRQDTASPPRRRAILFVLLIGIATFLLFGFNGALETSKALRYPSAARLGEKKKKETTPIIVPEKRCWWVAQKIQEKDAGAQVDQLKAQYEAQAVDANVFFRATAHLFWNDFVAGNWGNWTLSTLKLPKNTLNPKSTWTWVTGDQHLSNFGAWRNRNNETVFGVNDFDEAAIYDFHIDVLRIAVSICNHAIANGLSPKQVNKALDVFTDSYIDTVIGYVGNEEALLFELTPKTSYGVLRDYLKSVEKDKSTSKQLKKFTSVNETTDVRYFVKGRVGVPHNDTNLADISPEIEAQIGDMFSSTQYGATMMKLGWHVRQWDDDYFTVLDVAERIGSGIGSFGVDRYYVLLKGTDGLLGKDEVDGSAVILDIKEQPLAAVERVLSTNDAAWYGIMFQNAAARVVEAQRRLTSYVDPFTGWIMAHDQETDLMIPLSIRQRSPWKDSIDLDDLTRPKDFNDFTAQIAAATATSHVRGTVAKAPAMFKDVIYSIMKKDKKNRKKWSTAVAELAKSYHEQVLLDFDCFQQFVNTTYGSQE